MSEKALKQKKKEKNSIEKTKKENFEVAPDANVEAVAIDKKIQKLLNQKEKPTKGKKLKRVRLFGKLRSKLFDSNEKQVEKLKNFAKEVEDLEPTISKMTQEEMKAAVAQLKKEFQSKVVPETKLFLEKGKAWLETKQGTEILDFIIAKLPLSFALIRESAHRVAKHKHFEVQLMAGITLTQGRIIEFKTGEGKTTVAALPLFLYSLFGRGAYLITVNDYLARVGGEWIGSIMDYVGISVGIVNQDKAYKFVNAEVLGNYKSKEDVEAAKKIEWNRLNQMKGLCLVETTKKEAYLSDITYGTNSEFGFDYIRDNMQKTFEDMNQRDPFFAVVDEVDSILIDEARTPLIISDSAEDSNMLYTKFAGLVKKLEPGDFVVEEKEQNVTLTDTGVKKMEDWLGIDNLWSNSDYAKHLDRALLAEYFYKKDDQYIVANNEIVLVDEFTGRLQQGRRISYGIHQALEAKEGVNIQKESRTLATVTYQNYFRLYPVLSGMTGTALTEAEEFAKIYNLDVVEVPTNRPMVRQDQEDAVYKHEDAKFAAIVKDIAEKHKKGQPVLVGTVSVEKSEKLAEMLKRSGIKHEVLNAKNHAREAEIVARAGEKGAVTISTNMAGRGTDIKLGPGVTELGGLYVIGTERHESRRIDNQLRGRSGRQGDPGLSRFYLALDDEIMRIQGGDMIRAILNAANVPEEVPIESRFITKSILRSQRRVEAENFDRRKNVVDYDDVLNKQRIVVYNRRRRIIELFNEAKKYYEAHKAEVDKQIEEKGIPAQEIRLRDYVVRKLKQQVELIVDKESDDETLTKENIENIVNNLLEIMPRDLMEDVVKMKFEVELEKFMEYLAEKPLKERIKEQLDILVDETYDLKEKQEEFIKMREIEKYVMLDTIDKYWVDHLENMTDLRSGVSMQGFGQKDPLHLYQNEGFNLFSQMLTDVDAQIAKKVLLYTARIEKEARKTEQAASTKSAARLAQEALEQAFKDVQASKDKKSKAEKDVAPKAEPKKKADKKKGKKGKKRK